MMREDPKQMPDDTEYLRTAFAARRASASGEVCPSSTELFDAVHGQLPNARMNAIIDHVTRCAECAEAWRLMLDLQGAAVQPLQGPSLQTGRLVARAWRYSAPLAAAAAVVVAVGLLANYLPLPGTDEPQYRANADTDAPSSLVGDSLPRARLVLRWSGSGADASYTLRVMTTSLEPLLVKEDLRQTEYLVPASALVGVAADAELLWQVEALWPGGRRETSPSYVLRVR